MVLVGVPEPSREPWRSDPGPAPSQEPAGTLQETPSHNREMTPGITATIRASMLTNAAGYCAVGERLRYHLPMMACRAALASMTG